MDLVGTVYQVTQSFPREEIYGLTAQVRRAAISVPSNIAEGQGRRSSRDFLQFLSIASGSLHEVETQVLIAQRLGYIDQRNITNILEQISRVGQLINGLKRSLEHKK